MAPQDCDLVMAPAAWRWGRWRHPTDLCSCGSLDRGHKARDDSRECSTRAVRQASKTLRGVADLADAGLVPAVDAEPLGAVAARYAVAITADMVRLIDRARSGRPDRAAVRSGCARVAAAAGGARRSARRGAALARARSRAPLSRSGAAEAHARLPGLLPLLLPARGGGAGRSASAVGRCARCGARLHRWRARHLGGDPHRRRPVHALPAPHRRGHQRAGSHRPRQGAALAYAGTGGGPCARHAGAGRGAEVGKQDGLCGAARQPPARADAGGARGLRPHCRCRHPAC